MLRTRIVKLATLLLTLVILTSCARMRGETTDDRHSVDPDFVVE